MLTFDLREFIELIWSLLGLSISNFGWGFIASFGFLTGAEINFDIISNKVEIPLNINFELSLFLTNFPSTISRIFSFGNFKTSSSLLSFNKLFNSSFNYSYYKNKLTIAISWI